jgi:RNA polymerase sigma-70 factor (ECF subfamily)
MRPTLARWLTRNDHDAEDVVQDAYVRAAVLWRPRRRRARLALAIVRNTCYDFLRSQRPHELTEAFDEEVHTVVDENQPEVMLLRRADQVMVRRALELPRRGAKSSSCEIEASLHSRSRMPPASRSAR